MAYLKRHGARIALGLVISTFFALHATDYLRIPVIQRLDYLTYDFRLRLTMPRTVDPRIVVVDIDERSLAAEGRFPWSRDKLARLVDNLFDFYDVAVVGFDMVFAEADEDRVMERMEEAFGDALSTADGGPWRQLKEILSPLRDEALGNSLAGRKTILGYYFHHNPGRTQQIGVLPEPLLPREIAAALEINPIEGYGYGANLEVLQRNAAAAGFFDNVLSDEDGVFRRAPLLQTFDGALYEALSLAVASVYLGESLGIGQNNETLTIAGRRIPVDGKMAALVPYRGRQGSFQYFSATDILQRKLEAGHLQDKIVLVGTTAPGLYDLRNTPMQTVYPGVEIHANLISGILDGRFLKNPEYTVAAETIVIVVLSLLLVLAMPVLSATAGTALVVILLGAIFGTSLYLWQQHALVLPLAGSMLLVLSLYLFNMTYGFLTESRRKRELARRFGQYVPPEIVEKMNDDPEHYALDGERREMTVLFSDVRGFTRISERLDPEELSSLMSELLTPMTQVIHARRGTIDKYMGDAIMAFWGAPLRDPEHAGNAVAAALQMQQTLRGLRDSFRQRQWPAVEMGIGINTGPMSVGNMGSEFRMAYTVLGDAVNIGARLESLTKQYGVAVIVSEETVRAAPAPRYRELDWVKVKGRDAPIKIFEPLAPEGADGAISEMELKEFQGALESYRQQAWSEADAAFARLSREQAHPLYALYRERARYFASHPPSADWDGVFVHTAK